MLPSKSFLPSCPEVPLFDPFKCHATAAALLASTPTSPAPPLTSPLWAEVDRRLIDSHYSDICGVKGCGIFALQSKINHDCSPNSQARSCTFRSACIEIVALRPIAAGDEVSISYVGPGMSAAQRRADLWSNYGFKCACGACSSGVST
jgi:hypothetical protein